MDAGHGEAIFQQRPIESFAVEGDEYGALRDARGKFVQQRIFLGEIAQKELLDLQAAGIPPGQADEERVSAGAAGEAGSFRVEEKPIVGIFQSGASTARQVLHRVCGESRSRATGEGAENSGVENQLRMARCSPKWLRAMPPPRSRLTGSVSSGGRKAAAWEACRRGLQGREAREFVDDSGHFTRFKLRANLSGRVELEECNGASDVDFTANESAAL